MNIAILASISLAVMFLTLSLPQVPRIKGMLIMSLIGILVRQLLLVLCPPPCLSDASQLQTPQNMTSNVPSTNAPVGSTPAARGRSETVFPGPYAVAGPNVMTDTNEDEYTTTAPASRTDSTIAPVMARLVQGSENDVEELQEQLRQQERSASHQS